MKPHPRIPRIPSSPTAPLALLVLVGGTMFMVAARLAGLLDLPWAVITVPLWIIPAALLVTLGAAFMATAAVCALLSLVQRR